MDGPYDSLGAGWIALVFSGFVVGYILRKLKVLSDDNSGTFCTWAAAIVAALAALWANPQEITFIAIAGKLAIFGLVWVVFGLVFTIGVAIGMEKADKKRQPSSAKPDRPK